MDCKHCGNKLQKEAKFCGKCGNSVGMKIEKEIINVEYFSIPPARLALLSILTFGIYDIYWFYENWAAIKKYEKLKILPFGRAFFVVFFCHTLFKKIFQSAKKHGYAPSYSSGLLATIYIILLFAANALGRIESSDFGFSILWLAIASSTVIPLMSVQKAINFNNSKIIKNFNENRKFSKGEIVLAVIGAIWFGLILIGTFSYLIPDSDKTYSDSYSKTELIMGRGKGKVIGHQF